MDSRFGCPNSITLNLCELLVTLRIGKVIRGATKQKRQSWKEWRLRQPAVSQEFAIVEAGRRNKMADAQNVEKSGML